MSSTILLPPRAQLCNRSCSNKHTLSLAIEMVSSFVQRKLIKDVCVMSWEQQQKMQQLVELVRSNPAVHSCIQRIVSEVAPPSITILEGGKSLTPD